MEQDGAPSQPVNASLEAVMLALVAQAGPDKSVTPEQVARALDPEGWRRRLGQVRAAAVGLARQGRICILRHGKAVDPDSFKGVYRLTSPRPA